MVEDERPQVSASVTCDTFFGGRLVLHQPAKGHRSGTDAVLLAAAVPRDFCGRVYDVGAGVGAVGLGIALACPGAQVTLVEKDTASAALAEENVAANHLGARVTVTVCDVLDVAARQAALAARADLVVTNPPFHRAGHVRGSPDIGRRAAHVLGADQSTEGWLVACLDLLQAKGTLVVLHQAAAVPDLLEALRRRAGDVTLKPVHPRSGEPAVRVLVRAKKASRAPFRLAAPLVLHEGAAFTAEAARLHDGLAAIDW